MLSLDILYDEALALQAKEVWRTKPNIGYFLGVRTLQDGTWFSYATDFGNFITIFDDAKGVSAFRQFLDIEGWHKTPEPERIDLIHGYPGYNFSFVDSAEAKEWPNGSELLDYCERRGLQLNGRHDCPVFQALRPKRVPVAINMEGDVRILSAVLRAYLCVDQLLQDEDFDSSELQPIPEHYEDEAKVFLLAEQPDGSFVREIAKLPPYLKESPLELVMNDIQAARLRRLKKNGRVWCADRFLSDVPYDIGEKTPLSPWEKFARRKQPMKNGIFPDCLLLLDDSNGEVVLAEICKMAVGQEEYFFKCLQDVLQTRGLPRQIVVCSEQAEHYFGTFCQQLGIQLQLNPSMDEFLAPMRNSLEELDGMYYVDGGGNLDSELDSMLAMAELQDILSENFKGESLDELSNEDFAAMLEYGLQNDFNNEMWGMLQEEYRFRLQAGLIGGLTLKPGRKDNS